MRNMRNNYIGSKPYYINYVYLNQPTVHYFSYIYVSGYPSYSIGGSSLNSAESEEVGSDHVRRHMPKN